MEAFTTRIFLCLGNRRFASGAVITLAKEEGQLAFDDASSNGVGYLEVGVRCLVGGSKGVLLYFEPGAGCHGNINVDWCSQRV